MTSQNQDETTAAANAAAASEFYNLHEIVRKARANLNQNDWDYIVGGTESETTLRRNRMALDSIALRPRVLRDVSKVDASVEVLGRKLRLPVVLCPVGSLESFHPGGAEPVVQAAAEFGFGDACPAKGPVEFGLRRDQGGQTNRTIALTATLPGGGQPPPLLNVVGDYHA